MTIIDAFAVVALGALIATGLLWPWFEDAKDDPWLD